MGDLDGLVNYGAETDDELRKRNLPQNKKPFDKEKRVIVAEVPIESGSENPEEEGTELTIIKGDELDREIFPGEGQRSRRPSSTKGIGSFNNKDDQDKETEEDGQTVSSFEGESIFSRRMIIAGGFLDIALFTTNCEQLKTILEIGKAHKFYEVVLGMLITSMILQVGAGLTLFLAGCITIKNPEDKKKSDIMNHISMGLVALITIVNIFITSFTVQSEFITRCKNGDFNVFKTD